MTVLGQLTCIAPTASQVPAVVALDQRALGGLWSEDGYRRELESSNSCLRVLAIPGRVADDSATLLGIGCAWAILDEAHITLLAIDPAYQRRGLGQWLLLHILADARQRGLKRATLEVRVSNARAIALYERFGFVALGERRRYYPDGENALILWHNHLQTEQFSQSLQQWQSNAAQRLQQQGWCLQRMVKPLGST